MAGEYHCPCAAGVQCEGWHSPIGVSKAREGKQKPSQVTRDWCLVLGTDAPSHHSQSVPNPFPYLATAVGVAHFHLGSDRLVAAQLG